MSSSVWANALLVIVLLAPLVAVAVAGVAAVSQGDRRWTTIGCAIAAAGSTVLLVSGQHPHVSRLAPDDLALAAMVAIALLALSLRSESRVPVLAAAVTVASCAVAAGAPGQPSTAGPVIGIAAVTALLALTDGGGRPTTAAMGGGVVVLAAGVHTGGHGGEAAVLVGAALVALAASVVPRRAHVVVVPLVLVLGLHVGPTLAGTSTARWVAVGLAGAAAALAVLPAVVPRCAAPAIGAVLVPWTLASAAGPFAGTPSAARALAAGTVLALALGGALALLAAVPGAVMLVDAIADGTGWVRVALAVFAIATLIGATGVQADARTVRVRAIDAVLLGSGVWLLVRPSSWTWARTEGLRAYSDGAALALAAALITGVLFAITGGRLAAEPIVPWLVADNEGKDDGDGVAPVALDVPMAAMAALMGIVAIALVRSARL